MSRPHASFAVCAALCFVLFRSGVAALAAPPATAPSLKVPRLDFKKRVLENGLTIYALEDHSSPRVAIQVWYKVGGKDDPQGRSGFAHLFEHLMFKSTKYMKSEMMDRLTEDIGGENNAYTSNDQTVYYETIPSNHLERLLWAEAERMSNLNVNDANFKSERDVVEEEFRQSVLAPPYGRLQMLIEQRSYTTHPYRLPVIGNIEELNAATIDDVRAFHTNYYRPDNATLIVVGDFEQAQLDAWVDEYFAKIPKPETPITRTTIQEPGRTAEKRYYETNDNVPLPAIALTYLVPGIAGDDAYALNIAQAILSDGESSRLYQSLVYSQQVAASASADTDLHQDAGLLIVRATLASGKSTEEGEKALIAQVDKMQQSPVSATELEKAKNQAVATALHDRETIEGKASALGEAAVLLDNPDRVNTDIARLQTVTAADVQRVMQKYCIPANRVEIIYVTTPAAPRTPVPKARPTVPATAKPVTKSPTPPASNSSVTATEVKHAGDEAASRAALLSAAARARAEATAKLREAARYTARAQGLHRGRYKRRPRRTYRPRTRRAPTAVPAQKQKVMVPSAPSRMKVEA